DRLVVLRGDDKLLQVQDDVGDILLDPGNRGELVQHTLDADRGDRRPRNRGQQRAPERVADRVAETRLERLDRELRPVVTDLLLPKGGSLCDEHWISFCQERPLYDALSPGVYPECSTPPAQGAGGLEPATSSSTRRSAAPGPECRSGPWP